jgi:competence protein ComEA
VPVVGAGLPEGTGAGGTAAAGAKPSLANATVEQLEELDGIGPTLAERIVEYRDAHGGFRSLGELRDVDGIGEKRFASLRDALQP